MKRSRRPGGIGKIGRWILAAVGLGVGGVGGYRFADTAVFWIGAADAFAKVEAVVQMPGAKRQWRQELALLPASNIRCYVVTDRDVECWRVGQTVPVFLGTRLDGSRGMRIWRWRDRVDEIFFVFWGVLVFLASRVTGSNRSSDRRPG